MDNAKRWAILCDQPRLGVVRRVGAVMFVFYGGLLRWINLDNLRAGVISACGFDQTINRILAEL